MSRVGGRGYDVYDDRDYYSTASRRGGGGGRRGEVDELDIDITRSRSNHDDRPRRQPEFLREDYGRSSNAGQIVIREDRGSRRYEEEELLVTNHRRADKNRAPPYPGGDREEVDIDIETSSRAGGRDRRGGGRRGEEIDIDITESETRRPPPRRRDDLDIEIRETESYRPRERGEDIVFRRGDGERRRPRDVEREEIIITRDEDDRSSHHHHHHSPSGGDKININIDNRHEEPAPPPRPRSNVGREEIDIRIREDESRHRRETDNRQTLTIRERSRERSRSNMRPVAREREEFYYRRRSPERPKEVEKEEIIIRRQRTPSPSPSPPRAPSPPSPRFELPPITRPPIVQEIITHHRHIDHAVRRAASSSSSSPSPPPPPKRKEKELEIEIKRRDARGNVTQEDIRFVEDERDSRDRTREREEVRTRRRSRSAPAQERREEKEESKNTLNAVIEINHNDDRRVGLPRPPLPPPPRPKEMWTEITKDLVSKEAIEYAGFEYEETEDFFYVMEYMRYDDVQRLVELSEDLYRDRRSRIDQIQWERQDPRLPEPRPSEAPRRLLEGPRGGRDGGYDEHIYEREVIYEDGTRRRYRIP